VGAGQLAMAATIIVVASFYVRKRTGQKTWRRLHYLSFLGATVHGVMAGSDSGAIWAALGYVLSITLVAFLLTMSAADGRDGAGGCAGAGHPASGSRAGADGLSRSHGFGVGPGLRLSPPSVRPRPSPSSVMLVLG
jgi:hypothetical protein